MIRLAVARLAAWLAAGLLASGSCSALSGMGSARVLQSGGQPCFALPLDGAPAMRLLSLSVTQGERRDWRSLPDELWGFTVPPPGAAVDPARDACIRYGDLPPAAAARASPALLQPARLYRVEINAQPASGTSGTVGYQAEFCLKPPSDGGAPAVQVVPWDEAAGRWRHEVCAAR